MFGFGKARKEAAQVGEAAARMAIMPFWDMFARSFDTRIWSDPYVLGLIQGSIGAQTLPITGRKLGTTDKGYVTLDAMRALGASQPAIEYSMDLIQTQNADFMRGYDHALTTFFLMAGALKKEAYDEPDIVAAREAVPEFQRSLSGLGMPSQQSPEEALASAYIYMKVNAHREERYPR